MDELFGAERTVDDEDGCPVHAVQLNVAPRFEGEERFVRPYPLGVEGTRFHATLELERRPGGIRRDEQVPSGVDPVDTEAVCAAKVSWRLHEKAKNLATWLVVHASYGHYLSSMGQVRESGVRAYEAPAIKVIGSIRELTLLDKKFGPTDGYTLMGVAITNASP
jgi:hypothetical protein